MRLSEVLNRAPSNATLQVENFLGDRRIAWGKQKPIQIGRVLHNFFCLECGDVRTYQSELNLAALVAGDNLVSIDVALKCPGCSSTVESWYLIKGVDDLYSQNPRVFLVRYTENRRGSARGVDAGAGQFEMLLDQAHVAHSNSLGAGCMIYLRKIFELITFQVATTAGIETTRSNGRSRPFRQILEEVDREHKIIPQRFSENGYRLFEELSNVIHGDSDEENALRLFHPCRALVLSVVKNVSNDADISTAIQSLGWDQSTIEAIAEEGVIE